VAETREVTESPPRRPGSDRVPVRRSGETARGDSRLYHRKRNGKRL